MSFENRLTFRCETDVGVERSENQDHYGTFSPDQIGTGWLFVVADGMGGAAGGQEASRIAVAAIKQTYSKLLADDHTIAPFDAISGGIKAANAAIKARIAEEPALRGMGTTAVVMSIIGDLVYTAHVGDSRIYRYRDGRLEQLTRDHTRVQFLVDQGIITPSEARKHPDGHIIVRNLGGNRDVDPDIPPDGPFRIRDGDVFLLCSDGLYGLVSDEAIRQVLSYAPPEASAPALIELANRRGGHDNITVSVVCAGTQPASWATFDPHVLARKVDALAVDDTSDTALFEAYDPEALSPVDFETSRLEAVSLEMATIAREQSTAAAPPPSKPAPSTPPPAAVTAQPPPPTSKSSSGAPRSRGRSGAFIALVVIGVLVLGVFAAAIVGAVLFQDEIKEAMGLEPPPSDSKKKKKKSKPKGKKSGQRPQQQLRPERFAVVETHVDRCGMVSTEIALPAACVVLERSLRI
ncbi:MAG: protein phosphatase 2C domain-containing protein [Myxococcota bacterium]